MASICHRLQAFHGRFLVAEAHVVLLLLAHQGLQVPLVERRAVAWQPGVALHVRQVIGWHDAGGEAEALAMHRATVGGVHVAGPDHHASLKPPTRQMHAYMIIYAC